MAKSTKKPPVTPPPPPEPAKTYASKTPRSLDRAEYQRRWRERKKGEVVGKESHISELAGIVIPAVTGWIDKIVSAYDRRTIALASSVPTRTMELPHMALPYEPLHPDATSASLPQTQTHLFSPASTGAPEAIPAPVGVPSIVIGKYPDDPTGESTEPLFLVNTPEQQEVMYACMEYFTKFLPEEKARLREYDNMEESLCLQMQRSLFHRLQLPIPRDDHEAARRLYVSGEGTETPENPY